jgi:hypothetical protein
MSPVSIVAEITITITTSVIDVIEVAVATMTPEIVCEAGAAIRSTTIHTPVTSVMTINKLLALLIPVRISSTTSLGHRIGRRGEKYSQAHYQNSQQGFRCPKFHQRSSVKILVL